MIVIRAIDTHTHIKGDSLVRQALIIATVTLEQGLLGFIIVTAVGARLVNRGGEILTIICTVRVIIGQCCHCHLLHAAGVCFCIVGAVIIGAVCKLDISNGCKVTYVVAVLDVNKCAAEMDIAVGINGDGINRLNVNISRVVLGVKPVACVVIKRVHLGVGEAACSCNVVGRGNQRAEGVACRKIICHSCGNVGKEADTVVVAVRVIGVQVNGSSRLHHRCIGGCGRINVYIVQGTTLIVGLIRRRHRDVLSVAVGSVNEILLLCVTGNQNICNIQEGGANRGINRFIVACTVVIEATARNGDGRRGTLIERGGVIILIEVSLVGNQHRGTQDSTARQCTLLEVEGTVCNRQTTLTSRHNENIGAGGVEGAVGNGDITCQMGKHLCHAVNVITAALNLHGGGSCIEIKQAAGQPGCREGACGNRHGVVRRGG